MIKKVLLINPATGVYDRADRCQAPIEDEGIQMVRPPMDLAYMASMIESLGVKAIIRDYPAKGEGKSDFLRDLKKFKPEMLVLSVTTPTLDLDLEYCQMAKEADRKTITVAKGAHFYEFDREILENYPALDLAIRGEAEMTIKEITEGKSWEKIKGISFRRKGKVIRNKERPFLDNLDLLPLPARHLLDKKLYLFPDTKEPYALISAGRGCPGACLFCLVGKVSGKRLRTRSVKGVIEEIKSCQKDFGIKTFFFRADTFTWNRKWVFEFCQEIIAAKMKIRWGTNSRVDTIDEEMVAIMKKAGCDIIGFGIESGSQKILNKMGKGITLAKSRKAVDLCFRYRIKTLLFFIIGLPWETKETIRETINFAKELPGTFYNFSIAYPFPGTEYAKIAQEHGLLANHSLFGFDYARPVVKTFHLSNEELVYFRKKALRSIYFRPSYIFRVLGQARTAGELFNYFLAGLRKLKEPFLSR